MKDFGFKIVDRRRDEIEPLITRTLSEQRPIEVGLYFGDPEALDLLRSSLPGSGLRVAVHLDHRQLSLVDLHHRESVLREQLTLAGRLGASYVITHLSPYPMPARPQLREPLLEFLCSGLQFAMPICRDLGLEVHIENTYHGVGLCRWFHQGVLERGIAGVHVCFDIGHAKVWSTDSLQDWLALLSELSAARLRLHFHLHANRGLGDEHLSFLEAERLGITGPDGFTGGLDYYQGLTEIAGRFPGAVKVFEVPAAEAEGNLEHVLGRIASTRGGTFGLGQRHSVGEVRA